MLFFITILALALSSRALASGPPADALAGLDEEADARHLRSSRSLLGLTTEFDPRTVSLKPPAFAAGDVFPPGGLAGSDECCVPCTTPENACCLRCADASSYREKDLLMASMEGLTVHLMDKHAGAHDFLKNRAWQGNSHIGNRPLQATYYYDWVRAALGGQVRHVCEIGMNGGHSAVIFLAALAGRERVHLTMWDLLMWEYSGTAVEYVEKLYPGKMTTIQGNSRREVPNWTTKNKHDLCDVFSVDGGHRYFEAHADILNAARATRKGGIIILDDMTVGSDTRRAFDDVVHKEGLLADPHCVEGVLQRVGYVDRVDESNSRESMLSWCMATVL